MADLTLSLTQMDEWLCRGIWGVTRLGSALMIMPLTSDLVPATLRLVIAIALVLPIFPTITLPQPGIAAFSAEAMLITAGELLTGLVLGFIPALYLSLFALAGNLVAMQMGLGMAQLNDPVGGISVPALSHFYQFGALTLFIAMNGHGVVFSILLESYQTLPTGSFTPLQTLLPTLVKQAAWLFSAGLLLALPAIFSLLIVSLALGFLTRAAPQLNMMSIGFPATLLAGLIILLITSHRFADAVGRYTTEALLMMRQLTG
ncbi:flagellar biosynthetic protein FliR [Kistimonas scapharcae]|uniref:Flagellar biosynthetic protein FliR n=1 Tax=Kistimonas scapharcae TaxID=1036133 RepID=A0ABP8V7G9_9GAMM